MIYSRAHRLGEPLIFALGSTAPGGDLTPEAPEAGPELALLAHAYGWTPDVIESLSGPQIVYFLRWLPLLEARRAYPIASLEATVLNVAGGRRDDADDGADAASPPPKPSRLFTAEERLPPWAALELATGPWTRETAIEALERAKDLPVWALDLLDFRRLRDLTLSDRDPDGGTILVAPYTPPGSYAMMDDDGEEVAVLELPEELGNAPAARAHPRRAVLIR